MVLHLEHSTRESRMAFLRHSKFSTSFKIIILQEIIIVIQISHFLTRALTRLLRFKFANICQNAITIFRLLLPYLMVIRWSCTLYTLQNLLILLSNFLQFSLAPFLAQRLAIFCTLILTIDATLVKLC